MRDLFVDRVTDISIHQGIARMDFARLEHLDPEKQQASFAPSMRLVMPVEAFLSMAESSGQVARGCTATGKEESHS